MLTKTDDVTFKLDILHKLSRNEIKSTERFFFTEIDSKFLEIR